MKKLDKLSVPIIQGGMGVGISLGNLAGAVAAEGGMGIISTANIGFNEDDFWKNPEEADRRALKKEIEKAKKISGGNGLIGINVMVATTNFADMIDTACKCGIDTIISGAGLPLELPKIIGERDVLIAPIVSSGKAAKMMIKVWGKRYERKPDFLVVEGSLAGGHLGFSQEDVEKNTADSLEKIVADVLNEAGDIPVFPAGGVFYREDVEKFMKLGAYGVQVGTRFIATKECDASQGYKDVILKAKEEDVKILKSPVGMPGRGLRTPLIEKIERGGRMAADKCIGCIHSCDPGTTSYCINKALIQACRGNYDEGLFFCGANVGLINEMTTVRELIKELTPENGRK